MTVPTQGSDNLPVRSDEMQVQSAATTVGVALLVGLAAGAATAVAVPWQVAPLLGWDCTALIVLVVTWRRVWHLKAERTAQLAVREDPGRRAVDLLLLTAAVASLAAVVLVVEEGGQRNGAVRLLLAGLGVASVLVSWTLVHITFALRYARLYYTGTDGGVDFNAEEPPRYTDFAYLSFTIGMTYQVSDTPISSPEIRVTALRQAWLSYLFGAIIIASTINLVAGFAK